MVVSEHRRAVVDQFTRQAEPFAAARHHHTGDALAQIVALARPARTDRVLDLACGPGIVSRAFAPHVAQVTGADITPAMLATARRLDTEAGFPAIRRVEADMECLPFDDGAFDLVVTRYSFHHLRHPLRALTEMKRVCRAGGRVVVADVVLPPNKAVAYDMMETLRDPSHTAALTRAELAMLLRETGLDEIGYAEHGVDVELEAQLAASFPNPGDADRVRALFRDEPEADRLGVNARRIGGAMWFTYPTGVVAARKP